MWSTGQQKQQKRMPELKFQAKKFYELAASLTLPCSKPFVASQPRSYVLQAKIFVQIKNQVPAESNRCFVWSWQWSGERSEWGKGRGLLSMQSKCCMYVSDWWLDVKEKATASNDCIGCNFKPFRCYTFMNFLFQNNYQLAI